MYGTGELTATLMVDVEVMEGAVGVVAGVVVTLKVVGTIVVMLVVMGLIVVVVVEGLLVVEVFHWE